MKRRRVLRIPNRGDGFASLIGCFALLAGACASLGACHHDAPSNEDTDPGPCWHRDCAALRPLQLLREPFQRVHRTRIVTHINESETCDVEVSWPLQGGEGGSFHATVFPSVRDVFPIHGELVQLVGCYPSTNSCDKRAGSALPPWAQALFNPPAFAALSPGADDVFIPVDGHATLDGNTYVRADIQSGPDGGDDAVVAVIFQAEEDSVQERMRVGDSFPWSGRVASIVRIVDHSPDGPKGWVEIHLDSPSGVTNPTRGHARRATTALRSLPRHLQRRPTARSARTEDTGLARRLIAPLLSRVASSSVLPRDHEATARRQQRAIRLLRHPYAHQHACRTTRRPRADR